VRIALAMAASLLLGFDWPGRAEDAAQALQSTSGAERLGACRALRNLEPGLALPHLRRAMDSEDVSVRACAAAAVLDISPDDARALAVVRGWIGHPDVAVRKSAVELLAGMRDLDAVGQALTDADEEIRLATVRALAALGSLGKGAVLLGRLADPSLRVRLAAIDAVVSIGDPRSAPFLTERLGDVASEVRQRACLALGELGDRRAAPALVRALDDPMTEVQVAAARALARLGDAAAAPPLRSALRSPSPAVRRAAAQALGRLGDPGSAEALIAALGDDETRPVAEEALHRIGTSAVPALLRAARAEGRMPMAAAQAAVRLLGQAGDARALPLLLELLAWGPVPRETTIAALGALRDPTTLETLAAYLDDPDPRLRGTALAAVGPIADGRVESAIIGLLDDPVPEIRLVAARVVGRHRITQAGPRLVARLDDEDPALRLAATRALGKLGGPGAATALVDALAQEALRGEALTALARLRPAAARQPLLRRVHGASGTWRAHLLRALGAVLRDHGVAPPIAGEMLSSGDERVRAAAVAALAAIKDPATLPALLRALQARPSDTRMVEALASFDAAAQDLERLGRQASPRVRAAAGEALRRIRSKWSGWLLAQLRDEYGAPLPHASVTLVLPDGRRHECRTDAGGYVVEERIPHGRVTLATPGGSLHLAD